MNITSVIIRKTFKEGKIKAIASILIDEDFAVHDLRVVEGLDRTYVAMPYFYSEKAGYNDIVNPINTQARCYLEECVLDAYCKKIDVENLSDS